MFIYLLISICVLYIPVKCAYHIVLYYLYNRSQDLISVQYWLPFFSFSKHDHPFGVQSAKHDRKLPVPKEGYFQIGSHTVYITKINPSEARIKLETLCLLDLFKHGQKSTSRFTTAASISAYRKFMLLKDHSAIVDKLLLSQKEAYFSRIKFCSDIFQSYPKDLNSFYLSME